MAINNGKRWNKFDKLNSGTAIFRSERDKQLNPVFFHVSFLLFSYSELENLAYTMSNITIYRSLV